MGSITLFQWPYYFFGWNLKWYRRTRRHSQAPSVFNTAKVLGWEVEAAVFLAAASSDRCPGKFDSSCLLWPCRFAVGFFGRMPTRTQKSTASESFGASSAAATQYLKDRCYEVGISNAYLKSSIMPSRPSTEVANRFLTPTSSSGHHHFSPNMAFEVSCSSRDQHLIGSTHVEHECFGDELAVPLNDLVICFT